MSFLKLLSTTFCLQQKFLSLIFFQGSIGTLPLNVINKIIEIIENRMKLTKANLFSRLSSAFLQRKFFKEHFHLVVSVAWATRCRVMQFCLRLGAYMCYSWHNSEMEEEKSRT